MNIKILDSWLKEYLHTDASAHKIAETMSQASASIERVEKWKSDYQYDIEVTTNRVDLASVVGLAREAGAVLPEHGIPAKFVPPILPQPKQAKDQIPLEITNDPKLVNRICAVIMEITVTPSPQKIKDRLEASDIRSLNNLIDITNYVMRTIGYPTHVMDYDRINTGKLIIRESKKGEMIKTLDGKEYELPGGDIVADDGSGRIVDLLGIMGLENSVVTDKTKRIIFFINNDDSHRIRKTSMSLGIRTEAAQLNEKELDPELAMEAHLFGIKLFGELAQGKVVSSIIDIYPNKPKAKTVSVTEGKMNTMLGIQLPLKKGAEILMKLGFETKIQEDTIVANIPAFRLHDVSIPEDLVEEIARVYGYQNLPNSLPPLDNVLPAQFEDEFYWENRIKQAMKYWGYTEVYTYPMVSETIYEGPLDEGVRLKNPLGEEFAYMRKSLIPSLLKIITDNKKYSTIKIFEIANIYEKNDKDLPKQKLHFAIVLKRKNASFFELKGLLEQLTEDLGIPDLNFKALAQSGLETEILLGKKAIGTIEILDAELVNLELDFAELIKHATTKKTFTPLKKYPPIVEDVSLIVREDVSTGDIIETIRKGSNLIVEVSLLDKYDASRTFHIVYQSASRNLTGKEIGEIRKKILHTLKEKFHARLKE